MLWCSDGRRAALAPSWRPQVGQRSGEVALAAEERGIDGPERLVGRTIAPGPLQGRDAALDQDEQHLTSLVLREHRIGRSGQFVLVLRDYGGSLRCRQICLPILNLKVGHIYPSASSGPGNQTGR